MYLFYIQINNRYLHLKKKKQKKCKMYMKKKQQTKNRYI